MPKIDEPFDMVLRDPPRKSHLFDEQIGNSEVETECGITLVQPGEAGLMRTTATHTADLPVPEARCEKCDWDETLEDAR